MIDKYKTTLAIAIVVIGSGLLLMDVIGLHINMRGADAITGATLLGAGVLSLHQK